MVKTSFEIASPTDEHDEYWDGDFHDEEDDDESDDEEAFDGRPMAAVVTNGNGHHAMNGSGKQQQQQHRQHHHGKKKMKKMKVATQRDYGGNSNLMICSMLMDSPRARGICCLGSIGFGLILLFIAWIVPKSELGIGTGNNNQDAEAPQCQVHTTPEPFSEWMHHIRKSNSTMLCRPEVSPSNCKCHNPFEASYDDKEGWHEVFDANLKALNKTVVNENNLDLVLYGDSIIERMNGRVFGKPLEEIQDQLAVTKQYFTKEGGGKINALPLGIAGEEIHALMYRLKNGEMPDSLKPGAWWLMIGTNDVVKADCDVDAVVAGIVTVAEEILRRDEINRQYDASHVVINALFPRLNADPLWSTIQKINSRLECYANTTKGMEFFNATTLFLDDATGTVNTNMFLADGIHLTAHGMRLWEEAIVEKTLYLVAHNS